MKEAIAQAIAEQSPRLHFRDDYSGRGMYGRTTCSVETSEAFSDASYSIYYDAVIAALKAALEDALMNSGPESARYVLDQFKEALNPTTDNMGLGTIFY